MNFGLIGAGGIGRVRARALQATPGCKLAAVADVDEARARAAVPAGAACFSKYQQLLESENVDAVAVSTPPALHEEIVVAALQADKHVLCEKPLSNSLDACRRMVETARRTNKVLTTGFNHRYFPAVKFLRQTLAGGRIGTLDHVRAFAGHTGLSEFQAPWMYSKDAVGGGALMDVGIHVIDLARCLLGEVAEVYGVATGNVWKLDRSEDNGFALLRSPAGKVATLHATWTEWKGYRFYVEAYGDRGMARAYYAPMFAMAITMDKPGGARRREFHFYPEIILREKLRGWETTTGLAFQEELQDFIRLAEGAPATAVNLADGFAGFRAVEIASAVYESSATGRPVRLADPF
ncbi:MAG TPA: Gfo/Idh/MocA family oxidoreductase [Bryobacterales bacterium]|nr:Gfo/Idh/MocA family oxidoreductase [Bryobacterales bacterium]